MSWRAFSDVKPGPSTAERCHLICAASSGHSGAGQCGWPSKHRSAPAEVSAENRKNELEQRQHLCLVERRSMTLCLLRVQPGSAQAAPQQLQKASQWPSGEPGHQKPGCDRHALAEESTSLYTDHFDKHAALVHTNAHGVVGSASARSEK